MDAIATVIRALPTQLAALSGVVVGCAAPVEVELVRPAALEEVPEVPLARRLTVQAAAPVHLRVRAESPQGGFEVAWPDARATHEVPVLGLKPARTWTVTVEARPAGCSADDARCAHAEVGRFTVRTPPLPPDFPVADVRRFVPAEVEPGYLLATVRRVTETGAHFLVAWDLADLEVAWLADSTRGFGDVRRTPEGTLIGLRGQPTEADFLLRTLVRWAPEPVGPVDRPLPVPGAHHELYVEADGSLLTLAQYAHFSEAFPLSVEEPQGETEEARLVASRVIRFDREGALKWDVPLGDLLDDRRVSMSSRDTGTFGYDWLHTNAVIPGWQGDGAIVSVRHQDALVKIDDDGELQWILGDPGGWSERFQPYLLVPEGDLQWPYHPHAPAWGPDGRLIVFDNHNFGHTPYGPPPADPWASRVVAYDIEEASIGGTVRQRWSWRPEGAPLQSPRMGDADPLPITGDVLANFGWIAEGALDEAGNPEEVSMRLLQFDPDDGAVALDLWLRAPDDGGAPGVRSYRSEVLPSLYADDVVVLPRTAGE